MKTLTEEMIEAAKTPRGGWTRKQLAEWGVPWPPRRGWKRALVAKSIVSTKKAKSAPATNVPVEFKPDMTSDTVYVFTDGSCMKNPGGPGGWAYVMWIGEDQHESFGCDPNTTNNRMEVLAAIKALEDIPGHAMVQIYSDSQYLVQGAGAWIRGWKAKGWQTKGKTEVANRDLWERLWVLIQRHSVEWFWIRGHSGHRENERCDILAGAAASKQIQSGIEQ